MLKSVTLLVWMCLPVGWAFEDQPYCSMRYRRLCQGKGRHVACQFPNYGAGPSCENYTQIKFTSHLKHFIISYINRPWSEGVLHYDCRVAVSTQEYDIILYSLGVMVGKRCILLPHRRRQRIASGNERVRGGIHLPRPQVMMLVEWDRELAFLAQRLADQCYFVHDDCRATVRYPYAGQTVGEVRWRRSSDSDELSAQRAIRRVFDAWWGERRRVYPKQLTSPFRFTKGAVWGHFSQLAVWSLSATGCGAVRHGRSHARLLIVCDFSHTNMLGQRTLPPGPLAPCPMHTVRRPRSSFPLLCAPVRYQKSPDLEDQIDYEEEEADPDDTIEIDEVPPPTVWLSDVERSPQRKNYQTERTEPAVTMEDLDDDITYRNFPVSIETSSRKQLTKRRQTKTELKTSAEHTEATEKREPVTEREMNIRVWRPGYMQWRESRERIEELVSKPGTDDPEDHSPGLRRPPTPSGTVDKPEESLRHKWKQTRYRPRRPGADALLNLPVVRQTSRASLVTLSLDKEDLDQLFLDTGFNVGGNKKLSTNKP